MNYPDPNQGVFTSMGMSPETYAAYPQRPAHTDSYPTSMTFGQGGLFAEAPYTMPYAGNSSPAVYHEDGELRVPSSSLSTASATSSTMGSPLSHHGQLAPVGEWSAQPGVVVSPGIVDHPDYYATGGNEYSFAPNLDAYNAAHAQQAPQYDFAAPKAPGFVVDPTLVASEVHRPAPLAVPGYEHLSAYPVSPALSPSPRLRNGSTSPFLHNHATAAVAAAAYHHQRFSPYPPLGGAARRVSYQSTYSPEQQTYSGDESGKEKQRCPHPDCGRTFKDLKAHMLTHQLERPEKCPIQTCDYHVKGFARKYDKNRHTLTHYKGTMVCGFCPGSGSAAEKSFNRADVFKRHLTAVHGVEQTPPNSRRKVGGAASPSKKLTGYAPDATGKCSTCSATFSNAQDFYEHLDDCVLRIVQQEDPAEAINAKRLAEVENDENVLATLERNHLPTTTTTTTLVSEEGDELEDDEEDMSGPRSPAANKRKGNPPNGVQKSRGMTHSRSGVPLQGKPRPARKSRQNYPTSWGFDKGQMTMKKRVMAVFDGPCRLAKDDMMLSTEHEVRLPLADGHYTTDLDVQTLRRAQGFLSATEQEKGMWVSDDPTEEQFKKMLECGVDLA